MTKTMPFDAADYLKAPEAQAELLSDAFASGNVTYITNALGAIARARGVSDLAVGTGLTRQALYKAFSKKGDPKLTTVVGVLNTLGLELKAVPKKASPAKAARKPGRKAA
jgi:probable addiction module antidote protein